MASETELVSNIGEADPATNGQTQLEADEDMEKTSSVDADCQPSAKKKARLEEEEVADDSSNIGDGVLEWQDGPTRVAVDTVHSVPLTESAGRRRSTRAVSRFGHTTHSTVETAKEGEEDIDDPDYQQLSDSDDDPDFAPVSNKKESPSPMEFTYKGRGRGRGRTGKTVPRATGRGRSGRSLVSRNNNISPGASTKNAEQSNESGVSKSSSTALSQVKRRGRPLVNFNSNASADSEQTAVDDTTTLGSTTSAPSSAPTTPSSGIGSRGGSISLMSPSKLHSQVNYPALKRQTQAVRLPEGPTLTPEQLKEIEAQFKSGDFVMAKKDMEMEQPPIWRIDGKSLLQKFQAFEKDGKILYRNISTYSGWTSQGKTLYVPVKAKFIFQSRYDIIVELLDESIPISSSTSGGCSVSSTGGPAPGPDKRDTIHGSSQEDSLVIPEDLNQHMATFEIFLQTLISQALDNNFLSEIYEENDEYFVDRVKVIEDLTDVRKDKLRAITPWVDTFRTSLEVWPCVNIMSSVTNVKCEACVEQPATKLALFYGQPYDRTTLKAREDAEKEAPNKNYNVCESCARLCQTYNTVCHRKYDYYSKCKATVTNTRVSQPSKNTTTILRELLGNDIWITGLFRGMCTSFVRVDRLHQEYLQKAASAGGNLEGAVSSTTSEAAGAIVKAEQAGTVLPDLAATTS